MEGIIAPETTKRQQTYRWWWPGEEIKIRNENDAMDDYDRQNR